MFQPSSTIFELYNEVGQRGEGDDFTEYHVRLYRIEINAPSSLGFYLVFYLYHFTDIFWGAATEENEYHPKRTARTKIVQRGSNTQHIRQAIAYIDAFTRPKDE